MSYILNVVNKYCHIKYNSIENKIIRRKSLYNLYEKLQIDVDNILVQTDLSNIKELNITQDQR